MRVETRPNAPLTPAGAPPAPQWRRWLPLGLLCILIAIAYAMGLHHHLSLNTFAENRSELREMVDRHWLLAILLFALVYVVVVALSLPGAGLLSIAGGGIFGWLVSAPLSVISATMGATIVFSIVRTSLGAALAERAGPFVSKLQNGFYQDAFSYMLFLRLTPIFPFFAVNAVAGLSKVSMRTFVLATVIGIIPGSLAYAWLGRGLDSIIETQAMQHQACVAAQGEAACPFEVSIYALLTPQMLVAFVLLGLVALIPVILKHRRTHAL